MPTASVPWLDRLAHDLRGPLTPLQTAAYLLRSGQVDADRQPELFAVIDRQTRQLSLMIDELGDWARANQGRLLGAREHCEPALLVDFARGGSVASNAVVVHDEAGVAEVNGDPVRLTQLFRTLIDQANARGKAAATLTLQVHGACMRVDLRDAGPAPDPFETRSLFEEPQPEPYDGGLGLRLLIARAIAEAHDGSLTALIDDGQLVMRCELPLVSA